jgi:hypothetical protein
MIDITIEGLNARQHVIADILWAYEDGKDADRFIQCLPTAELRNEAQSIKDLMLMAAVEQLYDGITDTPEASKVIKQLIDKK